MSWLKYMAENGARAGRTADGYPIRGDTVPFLRQHEYDNIDIGADAHVRVFDTSVEEHMSEYQQVLDRIANGMYVRLIPDKEEFVPEQGKWLILCRWAELKGELSPQLMRAAGGYQV